MPAHGHAGRAHAGGGAPGGERIFGVKLLWGLSLNVSSSHPAFSPLDPLVPSHPLWTPSSPHIPSAFPLPGQADLIASENSEKLYEARLDEAQALEAMGKHIPQLLDWARTYIAPTPASTAAAAAAARGSADGPAKMAATSGGGPLDMGPNAGHGAPPTISVIEVVDIEENIWAPR